jgi:GT2 family glycosyltransferase
MGGLFFPNRGILEHCRTPEAFQAMASKPPQRIRPYIPGTAFWLHRDVYLQVGGFDTTLGTYWEDVDFSQRAWELNFNLGFCERTKMIHSVGKTCHKKRYYTSYLFLRNKYYVSQKYNRRWHSRMVFRLIYWRDWTRDIGRAIWNADRELLAFKVDIAKDLLRKEARDLKTQAQSILSAWA